MTDTPHIQTQLALIEDSQAPAPNPDDSKKADARRGSPGHILKLRRLPQREMGTAARAPAYRRPGD